jgi:Fe-S oxidoreductase
MIYWWSRAASLMPGFANLLTQTPGLGAAVKFAGGLAQELRMPAFAYETFRDWFRHYATRNLPGPEVLLFPDTFNNFFRPETAIAAVHVLEAAGWRVSIPSRILCCARPLYDWGMLDRADFLLRQLLDTLAPLLARGVPIVGLEPACIAAFRDEVAALFPQDDRAKRLKQQSHLLSEFLDEHCKELDLPRFAAGRKALIQIHCHQHAVLKPEVEERVLRRLGLATEAMPTGCCGMASSFGFEADKYRWSRKIAEHALLPQLSRAPLDSFVLANGFSCREQIEQLSSRETKHIAELIAEAMGFVAQRPTSASTTGQTLLAAGGVAVADLLLGVLVARLSRQH